MQRFNRPRLMSFDDPAYQRYVEQMKLQRENQRAIRPPRQRDLFGGEVEEILRSALSSRFALSDRRILEYEERKGRSLNRKFRELDALVIEGQTRVHVFEIKASRRTAAIHRALRQLRETQTILKLAFRQVSLSAVVVDTGMITDEERDVLAAEPDAPEYLPQTVNEALAQYDDVRHVSALNELRQFPDTVELVVLHLDQLIAMANGTPLSLNWEADEFEELVEEAPLVNEPLYSTPDDDEDNSFAAAFRRASSNKQKS
jgi:hypothetical protein